MPRLLALCHFPTSCSTDLVSPLTDSKRPPVEPGCGECHLLFITIIS